MWGNFRQLWLQSNNLEVSAISNILSIASFISAICIFITSTKIKVNNLKSFVSGTLVLKMIVMFLLFMMNGSQNTLLLKGLIILDIILEKFIILSIYPLLVNIKKNDTLYSKRKLVEYLFRDIGILVGGIFIGKVIFSLLIDYNICLLFSLLFLIIAVIMMMNIKIEKTKQDSKVSFRYIFKSKIHCVYLFYYFIGTTAMSIGLGLKMLMLTNEIGLADNTATNYLLLVGLIADIIGIVILKYLTPKNDYLTLTIKFGIRFLFYALAFFINNPVFIMLAITWSILISTAYENKTDAPYINSIKNEYQLFFTNVRYMVGMIAESIGLFLAGITYQYGISTMLGLSSIFILFQLFLAYLLIYMRKKQDVSLPVEEDS